MKKQLYLRLKYGFADEKCDYYLYELDNDFILYKNKYISKRGNLKDLKVFLRKVYKLWHKRQQKRIAEIIGNPYTCSVPITSTLNIFKE